MEYALTKETCSVCETVFDGSTEQPIDLDLTLPDYCPDMDTILKCYALPSVSSRSLSGDRLEIDGVVTVRVLYLDASKRVLRCSEHTMPFSCSFNLKTTVSDGAVATRLKVNYVNCRALTPRRLDIHGAFSVFATVKTRSEREFVASIEGDDIRQKHKSVSMSELCGFGQQQFSVSETLDFGQGHTTPELILNSDLHAYISEFKAISGKLMLKGELVLDLLYITDLETGTQETMRFSVPLSRVIDVSGLEPDCKCIVNLEMLGFDTLLRGDYTEQTALVSLDARLAVTVCAYTERMISVVDDAYSVIYELEPIYKQLPLSKLILSDIFAFSEKSEVSLGHRISKMIDLRSEGVTTLLSFDADTYTVKGKITCSILALDNDNIPFYAERTVDFQTTRPLSEVPSAPEGHITVNIAGLNYRITGEDSIEIKVDFRINAEAFDSTLCKAVISASGNEEHRRTKDDHAALTLYYADEGENLWEIARTYCTSVEAVRLENDLPEDTENIQGMILIPM
ncbi:MAG: DUF3794 domain-containing protein [Acutalibacteraceae bacterium]